MIEHMFARSPYHDYFLPSDTAQSRGLIAQLGLASRAENRAAALRLKVIGELFELRRGERGEREERSESCRTKHENLHAGETSTSRADAKARHPAHERATRATHQALPARGGKREPRHA